MPAADPVQKDEINRKAFEKFKKEHNSVPPTIDNAVPSERFDGECEDEEGLPGGGGARGPLVPSGFLEMAREPITRRQYDDDDLLSRPNLDSRRCSV